MPLTMHAEAHLSQEHDGVEFPLVFLSCTHSQRHKGNGAQPNKRPMESSTQSLSGTTTYKVLTSLSKMIINHSYEFLNGKNANNKVNRWSLETGHIQYHL